MVTTLSMDLARMGLTPWLLDRNTSGYAVPATYPDQPPSGPAAAFPALAARAAGVPSGNSDFAIPGQPATTLAADWRAVDAALEKVNLDTPLRPYPHQGDGKKTPYGPPLTTTYNDRFDPTFLAEYQAAQQDRQNLANAIYRRLLSVTGAPKPANPAAPTDLALQPLRWLAQLAVNIVDYIDEDEISTPFNFYTTADGLPAANLGDATPSPPNLKDPTPNPEK